MYYELSTAMSDSLLNIMLKINVLVMQCTFKENAITLPVTLDTYSFA